LLSIIYLKTYKRRNILMDKTIVCKDCGKDFIFTEGEQAFYKEKGFDNEPQRCPDCRRARKQQNNRR
jgi:ssDNA-binding Zn-finger/Zn-ribbon topoisomerase 1